MVKDILDFHIFGHETYSTTACASLELGNHEMDFAQTFQVVIITMLNICLQYLIECEIRVYDILDLSHCGLRFFIL